MRLSPYGNVSGLYPAYIPAAANWNCETPTAHGTLYLFVDSGPGRLGGRAPADGLPAVYLKVWADTQHFALGQVEALVREMEAVVMAAAFDT